TELVLFGTRGTMRTREAGRRQTNIIVSRKREHSRKPDEQYALIEACSPGPFLELFARHPRAGWTQWGNEAPETPPGRAYRRTRVDERVERQHGALSEVDVPLPEEPPHDERERHGEDERRERRLLPEVVQDLRVHLALPRRQQWVAAARELAGALADALHVLV